MIFLFNLVNDTRYNLLVARKDQRLFYQPKFFKSAQMLKSIILAYLSFMELVSLAKWIFSGYFLQ